MCSSRRPNTLGESVPAASGHACLERDMHVIHAVAVPEALVPRLTKQRGQRWLPELFRPDRSCRSTSAAPRWRPSAAVLQRHSRPSVTSLKVVPPAPRQRFVTRVAGTGGHPPPAGQPPRNPAVAEVRYSTTASKSSSSAAVAVPDRPLRRLTLSAMTLLL
jgi:hypothetical protein